MVRKIKASFQYCNHNSKSYTAVIIEEELYPNLTLQSRKTDEEMGFF